MVYLNDLYRARAEKAGIIYVDMWDGFVDDAGNYNNYGPDFEGQTRRLRSGDGAHFTRAGARKLAHYVEREIRRVMLARARRSATPQPQEPEPDAEGAAGRRRARTAAAPDREPGHVADRAEGRRRCAARRRAGAATPADFGRDARAGERRSDGGAGRTRRRFRLAAPRRGHGDRRAAARSGRAAGAGGRVRDGAGRATGVAAAPQAGRAAPAARERQQQQTTDGGLGLVRAAAAPTSSAAAAARRSSAGWFGSWTVA